MLDAKKHKIKKKMKFEDNAKTLNTKTVLKHYNRCRRYKNTQCNVTVVVERDGVEWKGMCRSSAVYIVPATPFIALPLRC